MPLKNNKALGQHWLNDRSILDAIADLSCPAVAHYTDHDCSPLGTRERSDTIAAESRNDEREDRGDTVTDLARRCCLEIGPGLGTLTSSLLKRFDKVIAVEYDERLATNLPKSFPGKNLTVINADFLKFNLDSLPKSYVVAGNIPYYITSPIITKLLNTKNPPQRIVLLIQKEVAERILEGPSRHTYLSLSVQAKAEVTPGFVVPKDYFTPPPKVDSAVIVLTPRKTSLLSESALRLAKQGFSNPRKKLINNLPYQKDILLPIFKELNIPEAARPSELNHVLWQKLQNRLDKINQKHYNSTN